MLKMPLNTNQPYIICMLQIELLIDQSISIDRLID